MKDRRQYSVIVSYSEADGGYIGTVPDLKGCSAFGETREAAVREIEVAMNLYLDAREKMVKERQITFSAPMVRAILAGRKTQTRRPVEPQPVGRLWNPPADTPCLEDDARIKHPCPYGVPGDRLWAGEPWASVGLLGRTLYQADFWQDQGPKWRPSTDMPRELSRLTLEVVRARVERLQAITEADAAAEGVEAGQGIAGFARLWDTFYADHASWESNPWVWVVEFRRLE
jgi:predicted RNase H-like HicB family nuclease